MTSTWHAAPDQLAQYATEPERVDATTASSIEQHLVSCAPCRAVVALHADDEALQRSWAAIADVVDEPVASRPERLLRHLGVAPGTARVVSATAELRAAWSAAVLGLAGAAVLLARVHGSDGPFLVLAPLVPLAAVLVSFLPVGDPGGEASTATPAYGATLTLHRVVAVVVPAVAVVAIGALAAPDVASGGPVWLLPGLALASGALALSTFVRAAVAAAGLTVVWLALLVVAVRARDAALHEVVVFEPAGQLLALGASLAALWTAHRRRDRFSTLEVSW